MLYWCLIDYMACTIWLFTMFTNFLWSAKVAKLMSANVHYIFENEIKLFGIYYGPLKEI